MLESQNTSNNFIISILQSGNCNNAILTDTYIDSLCLKYKVTHLYYFIGIKDEEIEKYSEKIFDREFRKEQLVSKSQIDLWELTRIKYGNLVAIIENNTIHKVKNIFEINESDLTGLSFIELTNEQEFVFPKKNVIELSDSLTLVYTTKIKIDEQIRVNKLCKYLKIDSFIFILDPLFNNCMYKLNVNSGNVLGKRVLSQFVPDDSLLDNLYNDLLIKKPEYWDTLRKYSNLLGDTRKFNYYNMVSENGYLYLVGKQQILTFYKDFLPITKSFKIIYKFDMNFNLISYYLDRYLNYSGYYPDFYVLDKFNSLRIQCRLIHDYNEETKKVRFIYYKLQDQGHYLKKYDKDSIIIPSQFKEKFYSNISTHFSNFGDANNPIWLMDPYPYIYYPKDLLFHDFINDSIVHNVISKSFGEYYGTLFTTIVDKKLILSYYINDKVYKVIYDLENRKVLNIEYLGNLLKYNINLIIDNCGKLVYFPIENIDENNYFYFE